MSSVVTLMKQTVDSARVVSLSHPIDTRIPALFGQREYELTPVVTHASGSPFEHNHISISEHGGTHMDAPYHFIASSDFTIEKFALADLMGRTAVIRSHGKDVVTQADIAAWEHEHGALEARDLVLFNFGWAAKFYEAEYGELWPGISEDAAQYLVDRGIIVVGIDALSIDISDTTTYPAHQVLLSNNVPILENLTNLDDLPAFTYLMAMPLGVVGGTGSPIQAVAFV